MAQFFRSSDPGFQGQFKAFAEGRRDQPHDVQDAVRAIMSAVRETGDEAVIEFTARFDKVDFGNTGLRIAPEELGRAHEFACTRIEGCARPRP